LRDSDVEGGCACVFGRPGREPIVLTYPSGSVAPEPAVLRLDGRRILLAPTTTAEQRAVFHDREDLTFRRGDLEARVRVRRGRDQWEEAESMDYAGTLELRSPGRPPRVVEIEGSCGC
jgi:hypothetical protein